MGRKGHKVEKDEVEQEQIELSEEDVEFLKEQDTWCQIKHTSEAEANWSNPKQIVSLPQVQPPIRQKNKSTLPKRGSRSSRTKSQEKDVLTWGAISTLGR